MVTTLSSNSSPSGNASGTFSDGVDPLRTMAAMLGLTGVALGAVGAHALQGRLLQRGVLESWKTAVLYQLFHAVAMLSVSALAVQQNQNDKVWSAAKSNTALVRAGTLMGVGTIFFSGSIYMLCVGLGPKKVFGPMTPVGGLIMMAGWGMILFQPLYST